MYKLRQIIISFILILMLSLGICNYGDSAAAKPVVCRAFASETGSAFHASYRKISLVSPKKGRKVSITNKKVQKWWSHYKKNKAGKMADGKEKTRPDPVILRWKSSGKTKGKYTVYLSEKKDFSRGIVCKTKKTYWKVYRLKRNTVYYWKVTLSSGGKTCTSSIRNFYTRDCARTLKVGGVNNVRDLGGYRTSSGRRIRQGLVFRSAKLDKATKKGKKTLRKKLKIRTDLDLRRKGEGSGGTKSPVFSNYISIPGAEYEKVWKNNKKKEAIIKEMKVFANRNNYPVLFHCTYGRDRTGTLAFMLNGLLGVKKKDLYRDYELTFLSGTSGKTRRSVRKRMKRFDALYSYMSTYKDKTKPLSENIEAFLLDNGITSQEIETIRNIMLE